MNEPHYKNNPSTSHPLIRITGIYDQSATPIRIVVSESAKLKNFYRAYKSFRYQIRESTSDSYWRGLKNLCWTYQEEHTLATVPLSNMGSIDAEGLISTKNAYQHVGEIYPNASGYVEDLLESLEACSYDSSAPIAEAIGHVVKDDSVLSYRDIAIVI